jgi:hypothetical protein
MAVIRGASLKGTYNKFVRRVVRDTVEDIPEYRRDELRQIIIARANLMGGYNPQALAEAIKVLR